MSLIPAAACVVTLPAPTTPGLRYQFILGGAAAVGFNVTFTSSAANITGFWRQVSGAASVAAPATSIRFTATAVPGDQISLMSNGTAWYCNADTAVAAGMAFA